MIFRRTVAAAAAAFAISVVVSGLTASSPARAEGQTFKGAKPVSPQPTPDKIAPGLAVIYYTNMFQKLNEIGKLGKGKPGTPIPMLDHKTNDGNVLTADRPMGIGAKITGLLKFDAPGTYVLHCNANDGVRVTIAGMKVHEDDGVHGDQMSDPIGFVVEQPGWYEIVVDYFQKKGTSALQLFWTPPGGGPRVPIPATQYAHLKG